jgi:hypothetical protein
MPHASDAIVSASEKKTGYQTHLSLPSTLEKFSSRALRHGTKGKEKRKEGPLLGVIPTFVSPGAISVTLHLDLFKPPLLAKRSGVTGTE